jgi:hypothetical protein
MTGGGLTALFRVLQVSPATAEKALTGNFPVTAVYKVVAYIADGCAGAQREIRHAGRDLRKLRYYRL